MKWKIPLQKRKLDKVIIDNITLRILKEVFSQTKEVNTLYLECESIKMADLLAINPSKNFHVNEFVLVLSKVSQDSL